MTRPRRRRVRPPRRAQPRPRRVRRPTVPLPQRSRRPPQRDLPSKWEPTGKFLPSSPTSSSRSCPTSRTHGSPGRRRTCPSSSTSPRPEGRPSRTSLERATVSSWPPSSVSPTATPTTRRLLLSTPVEVLRARTALHSLTSTQQQSPESSVPPSWASQMLDSRTQSSPPSSMSPTLSSHQQRRDASSPYSVTPSTAQSPCSTTSRSLIGSPPMPRSSRIGPSSSMPLPIRLRTTGSFGSSHTNSRATSKTTTSSWRWRS
mmetsp:Transcript_18496/g.53331  ORF Transcript_18496/g.53331 Transcript_18496/m.53331 type:complete len:259 (+) Transcript_18496:1090-1866(+)